MVLLLVGSGVVGGEGAVFIKRFGKREIRRLGESFILRHRESLISVYESEGRGFRVFLLPIQGFLLQAEEEIQLNCGRKSSHHLSLLNHINKSVSTKPNKTAY